MVGIPSPLGKLSDGISSYKQIREIQDVKKEKLFAKHHCEVGYKLLDCKKPVAAQEAFEIALKFDSKNREIHMGLYKSSIFLPILKKDPQYYDIETTLQKLNKILEDYPNDRHALYFLGEVYRDIDYKKASAYYHKVINLYSQSYLAGLAYNSLAYIAVIEKNNELAFHYLREASKLCEFNPSILNNLSYNYLMKGHYETSIHTLMKLLDTAPYEIIAYWNIINSLRALGNFEEAYNYNHKLIEYIEDENLYNYIPNFTTFFFQTNSNGEGVFFKGITEKTCYSYCSMALTCYLINKPLEADEYLKKAQNVGSFNKKSVIKFLCYNIECIQKNHGKLTYKLEDIKQDLLKLDPMNNIPQNITKDKNKDVVKYFKNFH